MNIKITHNWLLEYLDTNATPSEIQEYLSLCGPSVERVEKVGNDYIYDIEITSNRIDTASVFGIAQECLAILPQFGKRAELKYNPLTKYGFPSIQQQGDRTLKVKIEGNRLCSRFAAIVLKIDSVGKSPEFMRKRLELVGIKSINAVVDISNYLMVSLGQPTHIFDFKKILHGSMRMRESLRGEKIQTLDEKEVVLPGRDIVIEDGSGKLIDLCGIMGGLHSSVTSKTKEILLFVQTYNKEKIRRTSMMTGQRTIAATYFEKGLDEERVEPTLSFGVELLKQFVNASIASVLYDIYPHPYKEGAVEFSLLDIEKIIGVSIEAKTSQRILKSLGFGIEDSNGETVRLRIPSYRRNDIDIKEDVIEEIARIYGYQNIPCVIQSPSHIQQPLETERLFTYQQKIKYALKHFGLHESLNYSLVSKILVESMQGDIKKHLKLMNSISEEIAYLRTSLLPSLIKNMKENEGKREELRFFEIAKTYHPRATDLPHEIYKLSIAVNTSFYDLKGIIEALFREFHIHNVEMKLEDASPILSTKTQLSIFAPEVGKLGLFGKLKPETSSYFGFKKDVYVGEVDLLPFIKLCKILPVYQQINPYATIKLDLTIPMNKQRTFA
ncbi:hypothetical protein COT62_03660, partial [Candidatus Roizmanbacteria bacterium CG09_land_8_20_14_0_10_41_9]